MEILQEAVRSTAWCVDRKGKAYNTYVHPFGADDADSIEDAAWLVAADACDGEMSSKCIEYLAKRLIIDYPVDSNYTVNDLCEDIKLTIAEIECLRGQPKASKLPSLVCNLAMKYLTDVHLDLNVVDSLEREIKDYLNQNFIRVRFGSEFLTTVERSGALYFRISSTGFDWYPVILKFIDDLSSVRTVTEVTIEKDMSATGSNKVYVNHLSLSDFVSQRTQVMEQVKRCSEAMQG